MGGAEFLLATCPTVLKTGENYSIQAGLAGRHNLHIRRKKPKFTEQIFPLAFKVLSKMETLVHMPVPTTLEKSISLIVLGRTGRLFFHNELGSLENLFYFASCTVTTCICTCYLHHEIYIQNLQMYA